MSGRGLPTGTLDWRDFHCRQFDHVLAVVVHGPITSRRTIRSRLAPPDGNVPVGIEPIDMPDGPTWYHAMGIVLLLCAYWAGWLNALWPF